MRIWPIASIIFLLLSSCSSLPSIITSNSPSFHYQNIQCSIPFPKGTWRLVHSIDFSVAGSSQGQFIGVSIISQKPKSIHAVLMTIEGFVLFEGLFDQGSLTLLRSIKPFDSEEMAAGLMRDIGLMFFIPENISFESGMLENGDFVCRYHQANGTEDVILKSAGSWCVHLYNSNHSLERTVKGNFLKVNGISETIELTASGFPGYSLNLKLISAEKKNDSLSGF